MGGRVKRAQDGADIEQVIDALVALGQAGTDSALDTVFAALDVPTPPHKMGWRLNPHLMGAARALAESTRADVGARAAALLTPAMLAFTTNEGGAILPSDYDRRDKVGVLLRTIAYRRYLPGRRILVELYQRDTTPELRYEAAKCLCIIASDDELAAAGVDAATRGRFAGTVQWAELHQIVERLLHGG